MWGAPEKQRHKVITTLKGVHHPQRPSSNGGQQKTPRYLKYEQPIQEHLRQAFAGVCWVPQVPGWTTQLGSGWFFFVYNCLVNVSLNTGYQHFWIHAIYIRHDKGKCLICHLFLLRQLILYLALISSQSLSTPAFSLDRSSRHSFNALTS